MLVLVKVGGALRQLFELTALPSVGVRGSKCTISLRSLLARTLASRYSVIANILLASAYLYSVQRVAALQRMAESIALQWSFKHSLAGRAAQSIGRLRRFTPTCSHATLPGIFAVLEGSEELGGLRTLA
jgi:hypothetical protein